MIGVPGLRNQIDDFARVHVLCVGDLMLDRFVYGHVNRISPEAPIPILQMDRTVSMLGGAGNVVRNITALGGSAELVATVGADDAWTEIRRLLDTEPNLRHKILPISQRPTTVKVRFVASGQQLLRVDCEQVEAVTSDIADEVLTAFLESLDRADIVVISDYAKGLLTEKVLREIITSTRAVKKVVIVDPKSCWFSRYAGANVLTPNVRELALATGLPCVDDQSVVAAASKALEDFGGDAILVTRSERGMTLVRADGTARHHPTQAREVYDVSGAGDTVIATLALMLASGHGLFHAAEIANAVAGIAVGKPGTATVQARELTALMLAREQASMGIKIQSLPAALDIISRWRDEGMRVGFTNGCFDLLHPGHVSLLDQARGQCDRLVVGLNSDASVSRLKGPLRPIQSEIARATVLAALATVDLVIIFDDDSPLQLIEAIHPDMLIKGADYSLEQVIGADLVMSYGGSVLLANVKQGFSTSRMVERMVGKAV